MMTAEVGFDNKKYVGATAEGSKLTIDRDGRIYDDTGRWIADGKERKK